MEILNCYVDGSFNDITKQASWAFIVVKDDLIIHKEKGIISNPDWNLSRQIAGETQGVIRSLEWAKQNNCKLNVNFDYNGIKFWVLDLLESYGIPWKANKEHTREYRKRVFDLKDHLTTMTKIKAHSGNFFNEAVDQLAKTN